MENLSASKIVFIMVGVTACVALFMDKLTPENFMVLATGAFAFYFSKPTDGTPLGGGMVGVK